jgi:hypothetical protein
MILKQALPHLLRPGNLTEYGYHQNLKLLRDQPRDLRKEKAGPVHEHQLKNLEVLVELLGQRQRRQQQLTEPLGLRPTKMCYYL